MRKLLMVMALAAACGMVQAETYYLKQNANTISPFTSANLGNYWTNSVGVAPVYGQVSATEDEFWVDRGWGVGIYDQTTFPGKTLHLGTADGSQTGVLHLRNVRFTVNDMRWHAGRIYQNYGGVTTPVYGNIYLDCPSKNHSIEPNNGTGIILSFPCAFSCDDTDMTLKVSASSMQADNLVIFSGDNSAFKGKISNQMVTVPLVAASANALGGPTTPRTDALSIDLANAAFAVMKGTVPNAARGIAINKSGFKLRAGVFETYNNNKTAVRTTTDCSDYELPMPISGTYGFTKDGDGRVILSGAYTAGAITVSEGTLEIAETATLPAAHPITVQSGATLVVRQAPSNFAITAEDGARVIIAASYDVANCVSTPVALPATYTVPSGGQLIALAAPVALPQHAALKLEVLTIAAGAADVSAVDFTDVTEKTYGLPKSSISVEKDAGGVQHVYQTTRPVVKSIAVFYTPEGTGYNYYKINGAPELWSDNRVAHEGADYLLVHYMNCLSNIEFDGDSLTISIPVGSTTMHVRETVSLLRATLYPPTIIRPNYGGRSFNVYGDWTIAGAFDDGAPYVTFCARYTAGGFLSFRGALHGEGPLKVTAESVGAMSLKNGVNQTRLYGDNSDYTGRLYVTHEASPTNEYVGTQFGFNSAAALGGALSTFRANAITIDKYSMMCPSTNITFDTANRGISGVGPYGFNVPTGVTFAVKVPIYQNNTMYKTGAGTLALGGAMTFGTNNLCRVREGGMTALSDAAVAGLDCTFADGTSIVLSPDSTAANGFRNVTIEDADGGAAGKVNVALALPEGGIDGVVTLPICTVAATVPDLADSLNLVYVKGYRAALVKQEVTVEGVACVRYSVQYARAGLTVIIK